MSKQGNTRDKSVQIKDSYATLIVNKWIWEREQWLTQEYQYQTNIFMSSVRWIIVTDLKDQEQSKWNNVKESHQVVNFVSKSKWLGIVIVLSYWTQYL